MKWNLRCDCAADRNPLICSIYMAEDGLYLYRPPLKGRDATTGKTVKRGPRQMRLDLETPTAEIVECSRCRCYFALTTGLMPPHPIVIRFGPPAGKRFEADEYVVSLQPPHDSTVQLLPGLFLTPLGESVHGRVAPD
jgi:hypothetical protein